MTQSGPILVAGGGIGGLVAALALHAAGFAVVVFEAARTIRPLGVGINLQPHAVRELTELGLGAAVEAAGVAIREFVYANRQGQEIWAEPRGRDGGYHWPQVAIHRGRLQTLLWAEAERRLGPAALHTDARILGVSQDGAGVTIRLADGSKATGAALIAADGIHSAIRAACFPDEGPPHWNGCLLWRATSLAPPFRTGASMVQAGDRDRKFVCYPIGTAPDGRAEINWIAEQRFPHDHPWPREDWNRPARIADILPHFADWDFGWLSVPSLIGAATAVYEFPMVDRDPLPWWTRGRVTLLGDAAHPMVPIGSNGASQAILDGRWLARCLAAAPTIEAGLAAYEAARRPATAAVVAANRADGPDRVLDIAAARAPDGFADREAVLPRAELQAILDGYRQVAGMDPSVLNARESWSPVPRSGGA